MIAKLFMFLTDVVEEIPNEVIDKANDIGVWLQEVITPEVITACISLFSLVLVVFRVASAYRNLTKKHGATIEDVSKIVVKTLEEQTNKQVQEITMPLAKKVDEITPILLTFSKILALSQENTPTSRLAILELLQNIGKVDNSLIEQAKDEVNKQEEEKETKKQETLEKLDEISKTENASNIVGRY